MLKNRITQISEFILKRMSQEKSPAGHRAANTHRSLASFLGQIDPRKHNEGLRRWHRMSMLLFQAMRFHSTVHPMQDSGEHASEWPLVSSCHGVEETGILIYHLLAPQWLKVPPNLQPALSAGRGISLLQWRLQEERWGKPEAHGTPVCWWPPVQARVVWVRVSTVCATQVLDFSKYLLDLPY